uniref:Uncharacterized protein n=1 Tax=Trypanosoma congolense (strain IL3000) TaxID=1068625 RepID=G0UUI8_TRYCI|nr:hypothetical protein, unlikely [Trypanosoma congolense IL3000]
MKIASEAIRDTTNSLSLEFSPSTPLLWVNQAQDHLPIGNKTKLRKPFTPFSAKVIRAETEEVPIKSHLTNAFCSHTLNPSSSNTLHAHSHLPPFLTCHQSVPSYPSSTFPPH